MARSVVRGSVLSSLPGVSSSDASSMEHASPETKVIGEHVVVGAIGTEGSCGSPIIIFPSISLFLLLPTASLRPS